MIVRIIGQLSKVNTGIIADFSIFVFSLYINIILCSEVQYTCSVLTFAEKFSAITDCYMECRTESAHITKKNKK